MQARLDSTNNLFSPEKLRGNAARSAPRRLFASLKLPTSETRVQIQAQVEQMHDSEGPPQRSSQGLRTGSRPESPHVLSRYILKEILAGWFFLVMITVATTVCKLRSKQIFPSSLSIRCSTPRFRPGSLAETYRPPEHRSNCGKPSHN